MLPLKNSEMQNVSSNRISRWNDQLPDRYSRASTHDWSKEITKAIEKIVIVPAIFEYPFAFNSPDNNVIQRSRCIYASSAQYAEL